MNVPASSFIFDVLPLSAVAAIIFPPVTRPKFLRFFIAGALWHLHSLIEWFLKWFYIPHKKIKTGIPDLYGKVEIERDAAATMRDGVRLFADVYRPKAPGPFPVILIRLPYGKREFYCEMPSIAKFWARKGYACVVQDVRGKFASEGTFELFRNETADGYDTVEWVSRQPWCDGNVGVTGESYYSYTSWAAASTGHPNLKCVAASTMSLDLYLAAYRQGAFNLQAMGLYPILMNSRTYKNILRINRRHLPLAGMADEAGLKCERFAELVATPVRGPAYEEVSLHKKYDKIAVPALHFGGWHDVFLDGTLRDWQGIRSRASGEHARNHQWLIIGPWDHEYTTDATNRVGRIDIGNKSAASKWEIMHSFFERYLKDKENGFEHTPRVKLFVIGDNDWKTAHDWPPPEAVYTDFYFHSGGNANSSNGDGFLSKSPPAAEPADTYIYDPAQPVTASMKSDLWTCALDRAGRAETQRRNDVLIFSGEPLETDIEITGPISVILHAASSAVDTDFTAALTIVSPNGYTHLVQDGIVRASFRESENRFSPIAPGKVYSYTIDLWSTSFVVKKGQRLRVEISSSNFDRFDRNLNTGDAHGSNAGMQKAIQNIYHDESHPSRITLPVIPR